MIILAVIQTCVSPGSCAGQMQHSKRESQFLPAYRSRRTGSGTTIRVPFGGDPCIDLHPHRFGLHVLRLGDRIGMGQNIGRPDRPNRIARTGIGPAFSFESPVSQGEFGTAFDLVMQMARPTGRCAAD